MQSCYHILIQFDHRLWAVLYLLGWQRKVCGLLLGCDLLGRESHSRYAQLAKHVASSSKNCHLSADEKSRLESHVQTGE